MLAPAKRVMTCSLAGGRPKRPSNRARSARTSVTPGVLAVETNSGITIVSPRPSIPWSSSGAMPYAVRNWRGA